MLWSRHRKRNCTIIDEKAIDDTITHVYPGLKIRGSIMSIPLSEFIRIKKDSNDLKELEEMFVMRFAIL